MSRAWKIVAFIIAVLVVAAVVYSQLVVRAGEPLYGVASNVTDADGDSVTFDFLWFRNGVQFKEELKVPGMQAEDQTWWAYSEIPEGTTKRGETWECRVRAGDGEEWCEWVSATQEIGGWPPVIGSFTITTTKPGIIEGEGK